MQPVDKPAGIPEKTTVPDLKQVREWPREWLLSATLAVCATAAWLQTPGWFMLVIALLSTGGSALLVERVRSPRLFARAAVVALFAGLGIAAFETWQLTQIQRDAEQFLEQRRIQHATRIAQRIEQLQPLLTGAANDAVEQAEALGPGVTPLVALPATGRTETAIALFRDGRLIAHAGQSRVPLDTAPEGLSLVHTPFYTAMIAHKRSASGQYQSATVALLASAPPADRFTQSLIQELSDETIGDTVQILAPSETNIPLDSGERIVRWGAAVFARVNVSPTLIGSALVKERETARVRTMLPLAAAALCMLVVGWRRPARTRERLAIVFVLMLVVALLPLGALSNRSGIFDPSNYFTPMGGRLTSNIAALILTASLSLCGLFLVLRSPKLWYSRRVALLIVVALAGAGPFILRDLARGIAMSPSGASAKLWLAWQLGIALAGASVLVAGASAGQVAIGTRRGLPSWIAPFVAAIAAVLALPFWNSTGWPAWYPAPWIIAIALLALVRRGPALILGAALVAGCGAVTLTWGATIRSRMAMAASDAAKLSHYDENALPPLNQFAYAFRADSTAPRDPDVFLRRFASSDLAKIGYHARMQVWASDSSLTPEVDVRLAAIPDTVGFQRTVSRLARNAGRPETRAIQVGALTVLTAAIPTRDGSVVTISVPPLTYLAAGDPIETLTGLAIRARGEPQYTLTLSGAESRNISRDATQTGRVMWRRGGDVMHGDAFTGEGDARVPVHIEVDMRNAAALVPRGALLVFVDVAAVLLLWAVSAMSDGALWRWLRQRSRQLSSSYRIRLSLALLAFFAVPAGAFAGWAAFRLREDDRSARELIVREALRIAALEPSEEALAEISADVGASLYLYLDGQLTATSNPMLDLLAPIGRLLPRNLPLDTLATADIDDFTAIAVPTGSTSSLVGYRRVRVTRDLNADPDSLRPVRGVVASPARGNEFELDTRRADLAVQVVFALSLGALAALWLSGVAARTLARPVGTLREAALALAAGERSPQLTESPAEFAPVFSAFGQMASDLSASRDALEAAQRRTEAVLQHVASGVLAVNAECHVIIANPQAETMLGAALRPGTSVTGFAGESQLAPIVNRVSAFLNERSDEASFDVMVRARQLNARLTRLPAGAVLTLDDVTELASAERVLAWGEMARQVAHEIKNPLTPIRLGVQHLRRAYRDGRGDFSEILEKNVGRVLEEIDHLDEIARAFSRYGTAPAEREAPQSVPLARTIQAVLALESLGESGVTWSFTNNVEAGTDQAWARNDELKEVLINLLENARLARAQTVEVRLDAEGSGLRISVIDDGEGIAADVLPRIFEPHFSTRTSGSGLGLAISRRLIEGWGGTVDVSSKTSVGTTVRILLRAATGNTAEPLTVSEGGSR